VRKKHEGHTTATAQSQTGTEDTVSFLAQTDLFRHLNRAEINNLECITTMLTLSSGQILYRPGEPGHTFFLLKTGNIQIYHLSTDGRKLIIEMVEAGSCFGELPLTEDNVHSSFAEAITDSQLYIIHKSELDHLLTQQPTMIDVLLQIMRKRMLSLETQLVNTTFRSVTTRLASLLLQLAQPLSKQEEVLTVQGLSHENLADHLGVYRETVSTALRELKDAAIIELGRKRITISQPNALRQLTETDSKMGSHIREY
jgi:CRP-like cAMP-binding protein